MIYLDYNATTPLCDAAREAMLPYLGGYYGNPSSVHAAGREARAAIDDARDKLAGLLRIKPHEIIFTSGGTESCNLAVLGLTRGRCGEFRCAQILRTKRRWFSLSPQRIVDSADHVRRRARKRATPRDRKCRGNCRNGSGCRMDIT